MRWIPGISGMLRLLPFKRRGQTSKIPRFASSWLVDILLTHVWLHVWLLSKHTSIQSLSEMEGLKHLHSVITRFVSASPCSVGTLLQPSRPPLPRCTQVGCSQAPSRSKIKP